MQGTNSREVAVELLLRIEKGGAYLDRLLASPSFQALNSRDRAFARELSAGVERWKLRLDRVINTYYTKPAAALSVEIRTVLRTGLYQLLFMNSVPDRAAVHESVEIATRMQGKRAGGLVNAVLRRVTREGEPSSWPDDPAERLSLQQSYPLWLARRWTARFGPEAAELIMRAGNERHPVFIRTNSLRVTPEALVQSLADEGYSASVIEEIPGFIAVSTTEGLFRLDAFRQGLFTAQDPSAALASILLDPQPGESVIDLCAAPGGKATHLAELMGNTGRVTALDIHSGRLGLVRESAARLGLSAVEVVEGDARTFGIAESYDRVLLDAPCMGTAVYSKRPDMKWRRTEEDMSRLTKLQKDMLENAARLVRPGGRLVYSTCSLEPEENSVQINEFLDRNSEFCPVYDTRFASFRDENGYLILPHRMYGAGAFAAGLIKR